MASSRLWAAGGSWCRRRTKANRPLWAALVGGAMQFGCGEGAAELDYERSCPAGGESFPCQVFEIVNRERADAGLTPCDWNAALAKAAQVHCEDMAAHGYFDHVGRDGSTFDERAIAAGYSGVPTSENIAQGATTPVDVMNLWMGSVGHRANILHPGSIELGVGFCGGSTWVQVFGAARSG